MRFGFFFQLPCASGQSERGRYRDTLAKIEHGNRLSFDTGAARRAALRARILRYVLTIDGGGSRSRAYEAHLLLHRGFPGDAKCAWGGSSAWRRLSPAPAEVLANRA